MLVTLTDILKIAEVRKNAVGSFNTPNMASIKAVIEAAEALNEPVVITHAQLHEEWGVCKMDEITPVMLFFADRAKVPVCVHLDHGTDLDYVKRALDLGYTSVMYDGSRIGQEMNFVNTSIVKEMALRYGASVEGEIGSMGARESGKPKTEEEKAREEASIYTEPKDAKRFAEETGIDALACAFGAVHGFYIKEPKFDFDRLAKIKSLVHIPLVMHGGSGVSHEDYQKIIGLGIRKVNYYTYMARAGANAVTELEDKTFYHDVEVAAISGMKEDVKSAIREFAGLL